MEGKMSKSQREKRGPALRAANVVLDAEGSKCLSSIYIPADPEAFSALASEGECLARNVDWKGREKGK